MADSDEFKKQPIEPKEKPWVIAANILEKLEPRFKGLEKLKRVLLTMSSKLPKIYLDKVALLEALEAEKRQEPTVETRAVLARSLAIVGDDIQTAKHVNADSKEMYTDAEAVAQEALELTEQDLTDVKYRLMRDSSSVEKDYSKIQSLLIDLNQSIKADRQVGG